MGVLVDVEEHDEVVEQIEFDLPSFVFLPDTPEGGRSGDFGGLLLESNDVSFVFTMSGLSCLLEKISRISL